MENPKDLSGLVNANLRDCVIIKDFKSGFTSVILLSVVSSLLPTTSISISSEDCCSLVGCLPVVLPVAQVGLRPEFCCRRSANSSSCFGLTSVWVRR